MESNPIFKFQSKNRLDWNEYSTQIFIFISNPTDRNRPKTI